MFKKFFDMENPVMQGLSVAADLLALNLLTLFLCIPVVTAGAAITALHDVLQLIAIREETYPVRMYRESFRKNLKKSIPLGLIFLGALIAVVLNYLAALATLPGFRFVSAAIGILVLAVGNYAFGLWARFENTLTETLKNAARLAAGCFPRTLGMVVFEVAFYATAIHFYAVGVPVLFLFGLSLPCYVCVLLYTPVFNRLKEGQGSGS